MNFIVKSISEEVDWSTYHKMQKHDGEKDNCCCGPMSSEDDDKPKINMIELRPSTGEGYLRLPASAIPGANVGDRYSINFGQKNVAKA